jgi:hypothetical protein
MDGENAVPGPPVHEVDIRSDVDCSREILIFWVANESSSQSDDDFSFGGGSLDAFHVKDFSRYVATKLETISIKTNNPRRIS